MLNIASIFNGEDANLGFGYSVQDDFDFIAPDAEILIVDDNAINLTVAEGLPEQLRMNISTATGGKEAAMKLLGTEKLFWAVLKDYYQVIEKKANSIKQLEEAEDWHGYTIEVHALKSASKQIGAMELSEKAARMEKAGNEQDALLIHQCTDELLEQYLGYLEILK